MKLGNSEFWGGWLQIHGQKDKTQNFRSNMAAKISKTEQIEKCLWNSLLEGFFGRWRRIWGPNSYKSKFESWNSDSIHTYYKSIG